MLSEECLKNKDSVQEKALESLNFYWNDKDKNFKII